MTRTLTLIVIALLTILAIGFMVRALAAEPACMTLREARAKYPTSHLFKRRGCWGLGTERPRRAKPAPMPAPDIVPRVAAINAQVIDANGGDPVDAFNGPRQRFVTFALVDESKKTDMLPRLFRPEPTPLESDFIAPLPPVRPSTRPDPILWGIVLMAGTALSVLIAFIISCVSGLLPPCSRLTNGARRLFHHGTSTLTRFAHKLTAGGKRTLVRDFGPRNKQPYFHSRSVHGWAGRTIESGYANHPGPVANRGIDSSPIGTWARSRGLRPETPTELDPAKIARLVAEWDRLDSAKRARWLGKRFAKVAGR